MKKTICIVLLALVSLTAVTSCVSDMTGARPNAGSTAPAPSADGRAAYSPAAKHREREVGQLLAQADELWVLTPDGYAALTQNDDTHHDGTEMPGCGSLITKRSGQTVPLPLHHTAVTGKIVLSVAEVTVKQSFYNPFDTKIEAVYLFPLPTRAAVTDFVMQIGERRIRGIIRERAEAEQIYAAARSQGFTAALLTQERPNIFTQSVANIEPGRAIDVELTYFDQLPYRDDGYEFVFPMVVGPRFNPPGTTGGIGAAAVGQTTSQSSTVNYLAPGERSGHDISVSLEIDAGVPIERIECSSHAVKVDRSDARRATVELSKNDAIPNKDFVLRIGVASGDVKSALITHRSADGGYFALTLVPPRELQSIRRQPMEFVFVLDCSGSMNGVPLTLAKNAVERCLRRLEPNDTFQIIRFSANASMLSNAPIPATKRNVSRGLDYLGALRTGGGTHMLHGVEAALSFPADAERQRLVTFMTDGFIGNEVDILAAIHERLGDTRLFAFGVGSSVNRYLLEGMARLGRGAVAYVGLDESAATMADRFYERISHPALTDIEVDFGGMQPFDLSSAHISDIYVGRPVTIVGRFTGSEQRIRISGTASGRTMEQVIPVVEAERPELQTIWARSAIERLSDQLAVRPDHRLATTIRELALRYKLLSAYTAFIAVDSSRRTEGDHGVVVPVAVPVPAGTRYDTTVGGVEGG